MKQRVAFYLLGVLILFGAGSFSRAPEEGFTISIKVTNIRNTEGTMQFQVYRTQKSFAAENPYKVFRVSKKDVSGHTMHYKITLPRGLYGIALLDDENSNKEMDYGLVMPKEGFGFSDYYHTGWSRPTFYQFKFYLDNDKSVTMKVRYV